MACDLVAAAIAEEYQKRDPDARLNLHVTGGFGAIFVAGEVLSSADFDVAGIVRKTLAANGVNATIEPFIALELMSAAWGPVQGAREAAHAFGYATSETNRLLPVFVVLAQDVARALERKRINDPEWYWLGSDYEVIVSQEKTPSIMIRAEHIPAVPGPFVREQITALVKMIHPEATIAVNAAGEETISGLGSRTGASGSQTAGDLYGSGLPGFVSGSGRHAAHPFNSGSAIARNVARELVKAKKGKAVMVHAEWSPLEMKPRLVRVRNERGEDLSNLVDRARFDLSLVPIAYRSSYVGVSRLRAPFDSSIELPWETDGFPPSRE
ncbi:MAG: hypothetical protein Q7R83_00045 [bacterium]|nr:hypothetical protein [bacterium]